jgi:hypothetical protein
MNFKKWLENINLMEAKTEYPGFLPLPNDVAIFQLIIYNKFLLFKLTL